MPQKWVREIRQHRPHAAIVLVGTQSDLRSDVRVRVAPRSPALCAVSDVPVGVYAVFDVPVAVGAVSDVPVRVGAVSDVPVTVCAV